MVCPTCNRLNVLTCKQAETLNVVRLREHVEGLRTDQVKAFRLQMVYVTGQGGRVTGDVVE
jgi:hypothetical protein